MSHGDCDFVRNFAAEVALLSICSGRVREGSISNQEILEKIQEVFETYDSPSPEFGFTVIEMFWRLKQHLDA